MSYFKFLFLLFICLTCINASSKSYYSIEEFQNIHKNEKKLYESFDKIIKKPAKKINNNNEKIKIVVVYPGKQLSDYWRRSKVSFQMRLDELNINYELIDYFTKPSDLRKQSKSLLKAMKDDVDYLVFTLDANKHSKFIDRILAKEKPKLILQNITTPLKKWKNNPPFLYVGFDHELGSKMLADYFMKQTNKTGKYAVLFGTNGYVTQMRGKEFIKYIKKNSDLKLVDTYYTNFSKEKAILATQELVKNHGDLDFIYACSTDIALGVAEVLKKNDLCTKIIINGWGGGSAELEALTKQSIDVTLMRMNDDNGIAMAEAIKLDLENKREEIPQVYFGEFKLITKDIDLLKLDELTKKAFRYSK